MKTLPAGIFLCVLVALGVSSAGAQDSGGLMAADEAMVQQLLKPRSVQELTAEFEAARRRAEAAAGEVGEAAQSLSVAKARVDVKKGEIDVLKTRLKLAKKEGKTTERTELQKLLDREESALRVFQAMRAAAGAHRDRAEAAADFARSRMKMQEAELELSRMHDARLAQSALATDPAAVTRLEEMDERIRRSARAVLATLDDYAKESKRLAERTSDLAETRLELLDAWEGYKGF